MPERQKLSRILEMPENLPPELLVLPEFIQTKKQVLQLLSEILSIEDFLNKAQHREAGTKLALPKTTADLDKFAEANKRNVLNHVQRNELAHFLKEIYKRAPVIGMVLPIQTDKAVINGVILWFRSNVHAQILVQISVHNRLVGGAILRIRHKTYNFSLAGRFENATNVLKESLNNINTQTVNKPEVVRSKYF